MLKEYKRLATDYSFCLKFPNLVITKFRITDGTCNSLVSPNISKLSKNNAGFSKRKRENHEKLLRSMPFRFILVFVHR